jgi:integral membrane protein
MNFNSIYSLRLLGNVEGISYLLLLGIAMPMKYFFGFPMAVKIVGMAHGVLFIAYCLLLALQMRANKWNLLFGIYLFVATLIPFGTFVTDRKLAKISAD